METIDYKVNDDGVAILTIDLKDRSMNVLTPEFVRDLHECVEKVAADDNVKGAVLTSGKSSFVAGADLMSVVNTYASGKTAAEIYQEWGGFQKLLRRLETCGKPFAAAINGTALGGGNEIALACHYRVVADNPKAVLGQPEVQIGLLPGAGGTQRLPRLIGIEKSLPLLLQGTHVKPDKALELGMVNELVKPGEEVAAAARWIVEKGNPVQPWDQKGFKVPGGAGLMHPSSIQTFLVGTALLQKTTNHNYPAAIA
ncbi:MAG TPA: enoyl-CoA hydratase-related protein, partial [Woeseiaceae bacterium]